MTSVICAAVVLFSAFATCSFGRSMRPGTNPASREQERPKGDAPVAKQMGPLPKAFTNSLGMEFALVPKGKSWLGGSNGRRG